jgi:hypothetical protein
MAAEDILAQVPSPHLTEPLSLTTLDINARFEFRKRPFLNFQLCKLHLKLELSFVMLWECAGGLMPRLLEEA